MSRKIVFKAGLDDCMLFYQIKYLPCGSASLFFVGIDDQRRVCLWFITCWNTDKFFDHIGFCLGVHPFQVPPCWNETLTKNPRFHKDSIDFWMHTINPKWQFLAGCAKVSYIVSPTRCSPCLIPSLAKWSTTVWVGQKRSELWMRSKCHAEI